LCAAALLPESAPAVTEARRQDETGKKGVLELHAVSNDL